MWGGGRCHRTGHRPAQAPDEGAAEGCGGFGGDAVGQGGAGLGGSGLQSNALHNFGLAQRGVSGSTYRKINGEHPCQILHKDLARRSKHASQHALTEEATKTSVVLPLLQALGFDVFNLEEVIPEYIADVGLKKGEKIDFALIIDGKLGVLIEVKPITMSLGNAQYSQLYRYFAVKEAKLAVLTNGREIWFFSDMDDANKMDKKPFFTFDLQSYAETEVGDLARFQKQNFSVGAIREAASNLRFAKAAAGYLKKQLEAPDDDFVKLVGRQIFEGNLTKASVEPLKTAIKAALEFLIRERIQDKLSVAFPTEPLPVDPKTVKQDVAGEAAGDVVTTDEEMQAFMIVRAIAARIVDVDRITLRDAKSYCSIFVDDNNRKPVCRLYFNAKRVKAVGLFDAQKIETKHTIERLSDMYKFAKEIEDAIKAHAGGDGGK